jgi:hypothetical protein
VAIKNRAFLDLEEALARRYRSSWSRHWRQVSQEINAALAKKDYDEARRLVSVFSVAPIVAKNAKFFEVVGGASVLLGASRLSVPRASKMMKSMPRQHVEVAGHQMDTMLSRNATDILRKSLYQLIDRYEIADRDKNLVYKLDVSDAITGQVDSQAQSFLVLAASLQISRLSAFGFLNEANDRGDSYYEISAEMDDRTCEVCRTLDGQVFPVDAGLSLADNLLKVDDPDTLKHIAPWWSQRKSAIAELRTYNVDDLIDVGLQIPPYHPFCRCITVKSDQRPQQHFADAPDRIAVAAAALYGSDLSKLTRQLFGVDQVPKQQTKVPDLTSDEQTALEEVLAQAVAEESGVPLPQRESLAQVFEGSNLEDALRKLPQWPWVLALLATLSARRQQSPVEELDNTEDDEE